MAARSSSLKVVMTSKIRARLPDLVPGGRSSYLTAAVGAQRWATLVLFPGMLFG